MFFYYLSVYANADGVQKAAALLQQRFDFAVPKRDSGLACMEISTHMQRHINALEKLHEFPKRTAAANQSDALQV